MQSQPNSMLSGSGCAQAMCRKLSLTRASRTVGQSASQGEVDIAYCGIATHDDEEAQDEAAAATQSKRVLRRTTSDLVVDAVRQGASHLIKAVRDNSCFGATGETLTDMLPAQHISCGLCSACGASTRVTWTYAISV